MFYGSLVIFQSLVLAFYSILLFLLAHLTSLNTHPHTRHIHVHKHLPILFCWFIMIMFPLSDIVIETGAVKRPYIHWQGQCPADVWLWFNKLAPDLVSPWRGSALDFPVNDYVWALIKSWGFCVKKNFGGFKYSLKFM